MRANSTPPIYWVRAPNRSVLRTENASPFNRLVDDVTVLGSGGVAIAQMGVCDVTRG